ncbi:MAG: SinI family restriction endonuclease [Phycisphaeraceae bacterium]|nr:SinI family restriction endonuclease [Phycisphaeraceae bacterium]
MKLIEAIEKLGVKQSLAKAKRIAQEIGITWDDGASIVFQAIANDLERVPKNIGGENDDDNSAIKKWLLKYQGGKDGRASNRVSKLPGTIADPIIEEIIGTRIESLDKDDLNKITYAHRLGMSAENILGLILEEYLSENLLSSGWHCAWGETVKSVDFVHNDGRLLQIKNRSNSENSSSSSVRNGTEIKKWFRIKANKIEYMWESLNQICGTSNLSEKSFVVFIRKTISSNPNCLAVEKNNPWA